MSKARHLALVGGTAAGDAKPPEEVEDSPKAKCLQALALEPLDIIIGVLDHEGTMHVLSTLEDEMHELGALQKMLQAVQAPDEDCA
jgi:hypothetical protein